MRYVPVILVFALIAGCGSSGAGGGENSVGTSLEPRLTTRSGTSVALSNVLQARTRNVIVFMTAWCETCRREQPHVERFARENKDMRVVYVIAGSSASDADQIARERDISLEVYADPNGRFSDYYNVESTPTLLLFNEQGDLVGSYLNLAELPNDSAVALREPVAVTDTGTELGTSYDIVVMATDTSRARADLASARNVLRQSEEHLSEWKSDSDISRLNANGYENPVEVPDDLLQIIKACKQVTAATGGAFDMTWLPLGKIWDTSAYRSTLPPQEYIDHALKAVGSDKVVVEDSRVSFTHPDTKIGLGAVAKGWIVDAVFLHLRKRGYEDVIVNIGGDIRTSGQGPDGPWTFKLMDPFNRSEALATFNLEDGSVATSGNYLRYRIIDGNRYGHILDPRTGWPAKFDGSVSVFTRDCAMADALATALFVMGPDEGLKWANGYPDVEVVYATKEGLRASFPLND